jgi:carboxyl-terminal processing protease
MMRNGTLRFRGIALRSPHACEFLAGRFEGERLGTGLKSVDRVPARGGVMTVSRIRAWSLLLWAALLTIGWLAPERVLAGGRGETAAVKNEQAAVQTGLDLERKRRWPEAVEVYEKALESWPDNPQIQYGLRRAKIQFAVERRYADRSFNDMLLTLSQADALSYLDEILLKIRKHYVDSVSTTSLIAHGTESFYLALNNEKFLEKNLPAAHPDDVSRVRRTLRDHYWNRPIASPQQARQTVLEVCDIAERELRLPSTPVVLEYVFASCNALDDYSSYLTPSRLDDLYNNIEGEFVGIGIEMKAESGKGMLLMNVLSESPAEEGGARIGDWIVSIDGVDCRNMTTEEAASLLQGTPNSRVRLTLHDPDTDQERTTILTRRAVKVKSIPTAKIIDAANGIAYLRMTGFQKNTTDELDVALLELHRQGMKALIWDLRGNPGGLLPAAVEVLDRFLEDGVIVSTKGRTPDQDWTYSAQRPGTWNVPLVLLVDGDSASASEIVAGAVRDHHRGTIIGRKTYGKWSVQSILPCRAKSGLRLTTAKFYSPNGNNYSKVGVEPDIPVALESGHTTAYRGRRREKLEDDLDVKTGVDVLRKQLARR